MAEIQHDPTAPIAPTIYNRERASLLKEAARIANDDFFLKVSTAAETAKTFVINDEHWSNVFYRDLINDAQQLFSEYGSDFLPYSCFALRSIIYGLGNPEYLVFSENGITDIYQMTFHEEKETSFLCNVYGRFYGDKFNLFMFNNKKKKIALNYADTHETNVLKAFSYIGFLTARNLSRRVVTELPRSPHKPGTPEHHYDIFANYHICEINPFGDTPNPQPWLGGTHASPALHERRGHLRNLPSGKTVPVRSTWVGRPENGLLLKDYHVKS